MSPDWGREGVSALKNNILLVNEHQKKNGVVGREGKENPLNIVVSLFKKE